MSSITKAKAKSSDELRAEVHAALNVVEEDITELKRDLAPEHLIGEVILQERFIRARNAFLYIRDRPFLLAGLGLALGFFVAPQFVRR